MAPYPRIPHSLLVSTFPLEVRGSFNLIRQKKNINWISPIPLLYSAPGSTEQQCRQQNKIKVSEILQDLDSVLSQVSKTVISFEPNLCSLSASSYLEIPSDSVRILIHQKKDYCFKPLRSASCLLSLLNYFLCNTHLVWGHMELVLKWGGQKSVLIWGFCLPKQNCISCCSTARRNRGREHL